nr:MAG TPA: large terminase [Caudoviricetes sp.]
MVQTHLWCWFLRSFQTKAWSRENIAQKKPVETGGEKCKHGNLAREAVSRPEGQPGGIGRYGGHCRVFGGGGHQMITQTLHPTFGEKHKAYIAAATRATISVAEGAVRAGKTIDNIAAFAYLIEKGTPDRIHLATGSTAANAKLNIGDANGYGLEYLFRGRCRWTKYKGNEALVIRSHKRDYVVIFAGGAKADSFKKIRGNSYGMWIATEINLHHEDTIKEAFNRQLAARVRRVFWDLNPSAPGHWIYEHYIDKFPESMGARYNYQHFTIRDNATITPQRLAEIEAQYDTGSIWYRRDILGERCIAEGLIYPMFGEQCITDEEPGSGEWYISIDYGTMNPFSAGLWRVGNGRAVRVNEIYYNGRELKKQKTDEEYCDMVAALAGARAISAVIVDPSAASFIAALRRRSGFKVRQANNDVANGIRCVADYLLDGKIKIHRRCAATIREFGLYRWDEKQENDKPVKENDHAMDETRYFAMTVLRRAFKPHEWIPDLAL